MPYFPTSYAPGNTGRNLVRYLFKPRKLIFIIALSIVVFNVAPAYGQIDYFFGRHPSGLRLGLGGGVTQLATHYNDNPHIGCFIATLDYEFSPYFSAGIEGQIGTLQGIDTNNPPRQYIHSSTNDFKAINFNMKFGLGLINDFEPENKFQDAVKRLYLGIGGGVMKSNIAFTYDRSITDPYFDVKPYGYVPIIPLNIGTFIDIGNIFGYDRVEINPNYQITYIASPYPDGFKSTADSNLKGFYSLLSLTVKLKL
ncbi:hypothetical protein BEL04_14430 [Mucilaginibacter sp. PPCGB 2223]|uniref:hypothetical protein n=1 Tax=Mucilaginibacter sp. PPCGB 2223 TaxID=1886027 RepID=UPI0008259A8C|nr:hypothetical protein [Mucilaginibacter sp. PPCGB 2223]OCX52639.1 hypothetical protein BEL04_14430 [Mucilaginibacter sp. PPCGB 2223]